MNHQPYETWILEARELNAAQAGELQEHLAGCAACRRLQTGWNGASSELRSAAVVAPRAGFTRRWQAGMVERRLREQRRQAWRLFLTCAGTAAAIFIVSVVYIFSTTTPAAWIHSGVRTLSSTIGMANAFRGLMSTWLHYTPAAVNVFLWIAVAFTFCLLTFIWVFAMWRTSLGGVIQK